MSALYHNLAADPIPILVSATRLVDACAGSDGESRVENRHGGWMVVSDTQQNLLYCTPGADRMTSFFRSSAKPFQAYPLAAAGYAADLTPSELALCCASHSGSPQHLTLVRSILTKADLDETALQCGPHWPLDPDSATALKAAQAEPTAVHNNCSGKHAGMLYYCVRAGQDPSSYLDPYHPLQQAILDHLRQWSGVEHIDTATDGCGAPVFYLPLAAMARLYAHLASTAEFESLRCAMTKHPELVGGAGRVDTVLMQVSQGQLLAKVGADGVICVSRVGYAQGLALKIADGNNDIRNLAVVEALIRLGWLEPQAAQDDRLAPYRALVRHNTQGRLVGHYQVHL